MVDRVESLRQVNRHGHGAEGWSWLVEAADHLVDKGEECSGSGSGGTETMLCGSQVEGIELRKKESL